MKGGAIVLLGGVGAASLTIWAMTRKVEAHPGDIVLSDLVISPMEAYVSEPVEISVIATNLGEETATKEIVCEDKYATWFEKCNKILIDSDEYQVFKEGTGSRSIIQKRAGNLIRVVITRVG